MHKVREYRPKKLPKKSWVQKAKENQERILAARDGKLMPDSSEIIREMREGKIR